MKDKATVITLARDDASRAVGVICDAFRDYPVLRYVLGDAGGEHDRKLLTLVNFFVMARVLRGEPVIGVEIGTELGGVALVSRPGGESPVELAALREAVWEELGDGARASHPRWRRGPCFEAIHACRHAMQQCTGRAQRPGAATVRIHRR